MANPITKNLATGTIGELLVQLRLLQHGVQSAPPLKDSGNDLIALKGYQVRAIQVKTSRNAIPRAKNLPECYHLLALVMLIGNEEDLLLDDTQIYLIPKSDVATLRWTKKNLTPYILTPQHVGSLFSRDALIEHGRAQ